MDGFLDLLLKVLWNISRHYKRIGDHTRAQGETNNELLIDEASRDSVEVVSTARNEVVEVIHIESENVVPPESEIVEIKKWYL